MESTYLYDVKKILAVNYQNLGEKLLLFLLKSVKAITPFSKFSFSLKCKMSGSIVAKMVSILGFKLEKF